MEDRNWNTKLLITLTLVILFSGLGFLWFGLSSKPSIVSSPTPSVVETKPAATQSALVRVEGQRAPVAEVIDGDTIKVEIYNKIITVRLIGIDTPETVDPRRPVGCFGKEASNETKSLLTGKEVILQKDTSDTDKYGRLLRYVFLPLDNGQVLFVDDFLVREGYARVLTYPPDTRYDKRFREAEQEAKNKKLGLWGKC